MAFRPWVQWNEVKSQYPDAEKLGRNCVAGIINLRTKPSANSTSIKALYDDTIVVWLREVVGEAPDGLLSRRWIETPDGYVYAPSVQPVKNLPNKPITSMPQSNNMGQGMWVEVTIPYVDVYLDNPPVSPWLKAVQRPRLYYSQVVWVDQVNTNSQGQVLYRVNELYGSYGDTYWGAAEAFRPITNEELTPINPDVTDKQVVVDLNHQTLSCMEGKNEVYFCRISSGAKFDAAGKAVDNWATPVGPHPIWRKLISIHMSGGSTGAGYDTAGIGWTSLFAGEGMAVHSTFWHNDFGVPRSHGCVNATPEDAKWVFRWTTPNVQLNPGDITVQMPGGTVVNVVQD
ncbi:MAG: L,D-transpeptidase [Anaerolineaceae bacterium]|nr:L,D-transpeptidase [Anaerolineaceae bacterium]